MVAHHVVGEEIMRAFGLESEAVAYSNPRKRFDDRWAQGRFSNGLVDWWLEIHLPAPVHGLFQIRDHQRFGAGLLVPGQPAAHAERKGHNHAWRIQRLSNVCRILHSPARSRRAMPVAKRACSVGERLGFSRSDIGSDGPRQDVDHRGLAV